MEDDFELNKASQNNPQAQWLYTVYLVAKSIIEIASGKHKSKNPSYPPFARAAATMREDERAEHTPQCEKWKKEKGKFVLIGGSELVIFKLVTGGSNVVELAPNLPSSFLTYNTLIYQVSLRIG
jgi:hypothetical protein